MKDKVSTWVRGRRSQPQRERWKIPESGWEEVGTNHVAVVQSLSHVWLTATPWTAPHQAARSFIISHSLLKLTSIESVMPSNHLILCHPLFLLPSIFPSIRVFSKESVLPLRWPKYWSFSFSISPSNEYSGLTSFRINCLISLLIQGKNFFILFWEAMRSFWCATLAAGQK